MKWNRRKGSRSMSRDRILDGIDFLTLGAIVRKILEQKKGKHPHMRTRAHTHTHTHTHTRTLRRVKEKERTMYGNA